MEDGYILGVSVRTEYGTGKCNGEEVMGTTLGSIDIRKLRG